MYHGLIFGINGEIGNGRSLGPHRMATYLREQGWDIEVCEYVFFWQLDELKEFARSRITSNTKFIGFGQIFPVWNDTLEEFFVWIKQQYPTVRIIGGSQQIGIYTSNTIDYYVQGYGELAMVELLRYIVGNGPRPRFVIAPGSRKLISALEQYPAYPMQSLMVRYEDRDFIQPHEFLGIEVARGCRFECAFCNYPILGVKDDYSRSAEDFYLQIMDAYDRFGVENYFIADETFNDRREKITKFADVVQQLPFQPWFNAYIRADLLVSRPEDQEELTRMNVMGQYYGIETFNHASGKAVGKGMDPERLQQGLLDAKQYFQTHGTGLYRGTISLIVGLPHETFDSMRHSVEWLKNHWQGEGWMLSPVMIQQPSEILKPSLIDLDLAKYHYREMPAGTEVKKFLSEDYIAVEKQADKALIMWETDHMNIKTAGVFTQWWEKYSRRFDFRENGFTLCGMTQTPMTLQQRMQVKKGQFPWQTSVQWYIDKKLSV
jgi:hypothetical protein